MLDYHQGKIYYHIGNIKSSLIYCKYIIMEKKIIDAVIEYDLLWEDTVPINKIREDLDIIEKLGATHVNIVSYSLHGDETLDIAAINKRLETDVEYNSRIHIHNKKQEDIEKAELRQLEKLKAKYHKKI
jgi:hypothetical protein